MSVIYNYWKKEAGDATYNWSTSTAWTFQLMLISSTSYAEDKDEDTVNASLAGSESTSTTYSRQTMTTLSVAVDDTNDRGKYDAADVTFSSIDTGQVDGCAVILVPTGSTSDTGRFPICYNDSTSAFPVTTNGGDLTIQWSTAGVMTLS